MSVNDVPVVMVAISVAALSRKTLYPVTARLSVEAVHVRSIVVVPDAVAVRPAGTVGATLSSVVAVAVADGAEKLFDPSKASTV